MANENNEKTQAEILANELESSIQFLPRTQGMTMPAVQIVREDAESEARSKEIVAINKATDPDEVVGENGKTLQQVRNEFQYGVTNLTDTAAKHTFRVEGDTVVIVPPAIEGVDQDEVVVAPTERNIGANDAGEPTNPVEAKEAGKEPTPVANPIAVATIVQPEAVAPVKPMRENGFSKPE